MAEKKYTKEDFGEDCPRFIPMKYESEIYENGTVTDIDFDKFNQESADALIYKVNALYEEKEKLKQYNTELINKIDFLERIIDGDV